MKKGVDLSWLPAWVASVDAPLWISAPDGTLVHLDSRAAELLDVDPADALGRPCAAVFRGKDECGHGCGHECRLRRCALQKEPLAPVRFQLVGQDHWLLVFAFPLTAPDGSFPWIVHCAQDVDREHRSESYLRRLAYGTEETPQSCAPWPLSTRETEVLEHLASQEDLRRVARALFLSPVTVRNHVQSILRKLGVHSLREAVARWILEKPSPQPAGRRQGVLVS